LVINLTACATLQSILDEGGLSSEEIARGLKQALEFGINEGAQKLSAKDGYFRSPYKILLPAEAREITDKLQNIPGLSEVENIILEKINRGAEDAAKKAAPIFKDAITSMTFSDATDILMGPNNAATAYLQNRTYNNLYNEFKPVIINSLKKFNAQQYWGDAVKAYNKIPFVDKMNPELDDYVTKQALRGLFVMVEKKEKGIRSDISQRTTDLLRRVFARQDG
jgi:hypothetical protein